MRSCLMISALLLLALAVGFCQMPNGVTDDEEPYDEWMDSPNITLPGCGVFHRVRIVVDCRETEDRGFIRQQRAYLAAREILERLGGKVMWVQSERSFYALFPERETTIRVTVGSPDAVVYRYSPDDPHGAGEQLRVVCLSTVPIQCEGRVYSPVRAAAEVAGATVHYDKQTRTVYIHSPESTG